MPALPAIAKHLYPRTFSRPKGADAELVSAAENAIRSALKRPPVEKLFIYGIDRLRAASYNGRVTLASYFNFREPFLCVDPEAPMMMEFAREENKNVPFLLRSHPFNDQELEIMDQALPLMEPRLGETCFRYDHDVFKLPERVWEEGMGLDEVFYARYLDPLIVDEIGRMNLGPDALVCDPACGMGRLLMNLRMAYPQLNLIGSDVNPKVLEVARAFIRTIPLHQADAGTLGYLENDSTALFIASGLLNHQVVNSAEAKQILKTFAAKAQEDALAIITGKTLPLFDPRRLKQLGWLPLLMTKWSQFNFMPFYLCLAQKR